MITEIEFKWPRSHVRSWKVIRFGEGYALKDHVYISEPGYNGVRVSIESRLTVRIDAVRTG